MLQEFTSNSSSQALAMSNYCMKDVRMTSVEAILMTLLPTLKNFFSLEIALEAAIWSKFLKSRNRSGEVAPQLNHCIYNSH